MGNYCCTKPEIKKEEETVQEIFNKFPIKKINGEMLYKEFLLLYNRSLNTEIQKEGELSTSFLFTDSKQKSEFISLLLSDKTSNNQDFDYSVATAADSLETENSNEKRNNENDYFELQYKYLKYLTDIPKVKSARYIGSFIIVNSHFSSKKIRKNYMLNHVSTFYGKEENSIMEFLYDLIEMNTSIVLKSLDDHIFNYKLYENSIWTIKNKQILLNYLYREFISCKNVADVHDTTKCTPQGLENDDDYYFLSSEFRRKARKDNIRSKSKPHFNYKNNLIIQKEKDNEPFIDYNKFSSFFNKTDITGKSKSNEKKENDKKRIIKKKEFDEDKEIINKIFLNENFDLITGKSIRQELLKIYHSSEKN